MEEILLKIHCYWMRELDIDGFRLDAVKHMGEMAVARFCSKIREFAYTLDKRNFFLFGELVAGDELCNNYIGPLTSKIVGDTDIYYGLDSVLDFPLYNVLPGVIKGSLSPTALVDRYKKLYSNSLHRGEFGRYLVTFLDNHDQVGSTYKERFGVEASMQQIVAGIGYILCSIGTPCIYYGTEQGFSGEGEGDQYIREAAFNLNDSETNTLNTDCLIYQEIKKIASIRSQHAPIKFGAMYFRQTSSNGIQFDFPDKQPCIIAFSRILFHDEILIAYNTSTDQTIEQYVLIDYEISNKKKNFAFLYGGTGTLDILQHIDYPIQLCFIKLALSPMQMVILKSVL